MSEHEEVEEHVHHAKDPFDKVVAGSMAIIAAMLAVVSVLGQHFNTETILRQQESSDAWAYYQAKNIRQYSAQLAKDFLSQIKAPAEVTGKYAGDIEKYNKQMEDASKEATNFKHESEIAEAKSKRFHGGEVFLEIGIVLSSLAILTKGKSFYFAGALFALGGASYAATALIA